MKNIHLNAPFRAARLAALGLTWSWALVAVGVGLNALVKSSQLKNNVKRIVPSPTIVFINNNDIFQAGAVVTSVSALIAVLCSLLVLFHLRAPLSSTALRFQGFLLAFCAIWLFSALVTFTHFYRTRSAIVHAYIGRTLLPDSAVNRVERALGLTSRYKDIHFLRPAAILPWFTFLFSVITSIMLFVAASRTYDDVVLNASDNTEITNKANSHVA